MQSAFAYRLFLAAEVPIKEQQQEQNNKEQNSAIVTQEITASFCHYGVLLSTRELT
jgi:hypothetical protein